MSDLEEAKKQIPRPPPSSTSIVTQDNAAGSSKDSQQEVEEFASEIRRAECIVETYRDVKIFPLLGSPADVLKKSKFSNRFDGMFVSSRAAQFCSSPLSDEIMKREALIVIETGKYVIPLSRKDREAFNLKLKEYAAEREWKHHVTPPVPRRFRDSKDIIPDTLFYSKGD